MFLREFRRRFHRMWGSFFVISVIIYFAYHLISGQRGFLAWRNLEMQMQQRLETRQKLLKEQDILERNVNLLKSDRVSTDYIEERAKAALGYARPREIVVLRKKSQ